MKRRTAVTVIAIIGLSAAVHNQTAPSARRDVQPPDGFRANRTSYSAVMDVLGSSRPEVPKEKIERLKALPLEAIFGALGDYRMNYTTGLQRDIRNSASQPRKISRESGAFVPFGCTLSFHACSTPSSRT